MSYEEDGRLREQKVTPEQLEHEAHPQRERLERELASVLWATGGNLSLAARMLYNVGWRSR